MNSQKSKNCISIAFSPDTDDHFMILPLRLGLVEGDDFSFDFISEDVQKLNSMALERLYDISAISYGLYPLIAEDYELLTFGSSVARKHGPAIVVSQTSSIETVANLKLKRIAVPGKYTTAFISSLIVLPNYMPIFLPFDKIPEAVIKGEVDAGILIHELQIDLPQELRAIDYLGDLWQSKFSAPLPLGANVIRRCLPLEVKTKLARIYKNSIDYALQNQNFILKEAIQRSVAKVDVKIAEEYISNYVNEDSLNPQHSLVKSINLLFNEGYTRGFYKKNLLVQFKDGHFIT